PSSWAWTGAGNGFWSDNNDWKKDGNAAPQGEYPGKNDPSDAVVTFDGANGANADCTFDVSTKIKNLTMTSGYGGTVTLALELVVTTGVSLSGAKIAGSGNFRVGDSGANNPPQASFSIDG